MGGRLEHQVEPQNQLSHQKHQVEHQENQLEHQPTVGPFRPRRNHDANLLWLKLRHRDSL